MVHESRQKRYLSSSSWNQHSTTSDASRQDCLSTEERSPANRILAFARDLNLGPMTLIHELDLKCVREKKETKIFLVISSTKLGRF